jgi:hypothetical protein
MQPTSNCCDLGEPWGQLQAGLLPPYRLNPSQRWAASERLWLTEVALGVLDPAPDMRSIFFDVDAPLRSVPPRLHLVEYFPDVGCKPQTVG